MEKIELTSEEINMLLQNLEGKEQTDTVVELARKLRANLNPVIDGRIVHNTEFAVNLVKHLSGRFLSLDKMDDIIEGAMRLLRWQRATVTDPDEKAFLDSNNGLFG